MIQELINFTNDLITDIPDIVNWNNKPSNGLHIFIELNENYEWINKRMEQNIDYLYFDGNITDDNKSLCREFLKYQNASDFITMNKVKRFDTKQKIHSCSPFSVAFNLKIEQEYIESYKKNLKIDKNKKIKLYSIKERCCYCENSLKLNIIKERLHDYCKNSIKIYKLKEEETEIVKKFISLIKTDLLLILPNIKKFSSLKKEDYIRIYLKSYPIDKQETYYEIYLKENIFNDEQYSIKHNNEKYGVSGYMTTFSDKKQFLKHQTSLLKDGISQRLSEKEILTIEQFKKLFKRKILPNPLPIFIDKEEFKNQTDIINIFKNKGDKFTYSEIIKEIFKNNKNTILSNYYLLNMFQTKEGLIINNFDFVTLFRYELNDCIIKNIFNIKDCNDKNIENVFDFENIIISKIFNNSLVKFKDDIKTLNYFNDIKVKFVIGGETIYNLILKYRKSIYDYIYHSKASISSVMLDDIMLNSIKYDIRNDKNKSNDITIKEKLNIWFSLYNFFEINNNQNRNNMENKINDHRQMIKEIIEGNRHIVTDDELVYCSGQVIKYILNKSKSSDKSYSRLSTFLQKTNFRDFKDSIIKIFDTYKHVESSSKFNKLFTQIMDCETKINLQDVVSSLLAGYFDKNELYSNK